MKTIKIKFTFLANFDWNPKKFLSQVEDDYYKASGKKLRVDIDYKKVELIPEWYGNLYIDPRWMNQYPELTILGLPPEQWKAKDSWGWHIQKRIHLSAGKEKERDFGKPRLVHRLEHEIRHLLHEMELSVTHSGKEDPTHLYLGNKSDLKGSLKNLDYEEIKKYINDHS